MRAKSTSFSSGSWEEADDLPRIAVSSATQLGVSANVVLLRGTFVQDACGLKELSVSVDPIALERKLAIREMSASLDGVTSTKGSTSSGTSLHR